MRLISVILCATLLTGCTSSSTRQAIITYEQTQHQQSQQFAYIYKQSNQLLFLSSWGAMKTATSDADRLEVFKKYAMARTSLEDSRLQYERIRAMSLSVVGVYLYNSQGWANAVFQDRADLLDRGMEAVDVGNKAAGVNSIKELFQAPSTPPLRPDVVDEGAGSTLRSLIDKYSNITE